MCIINLLLEDATNRTARSSSQQTLITMYYDKVNIVYNDR